AGFLEIVGRARTAVVAGPSLLVVAQHAVLEPHSRTRSAAVPPAVPGDLWVGRSGLGGLVDRNLEVADSRELAQSTPGAETCPCAVEPVALLVGGQGGLCGGRDSPTQSQPRSQGQG